MQAAGRDGWEGFVEKAVTAYQQRARHIAGQPEPFEEERWYAAYMAAVLGQQFNDLITVVAERPWRAEAALDLSLLAEHLGSIGTAFAYALLAVEATKQPHRDSLFLDTTAYGFRAYDRLGTIAFYACFYQAGFEACNECLRLYGDTAPQVDVARVIANRAYYLELAKPVTPQ